jgi:hypothetical protein
LRGRPVKVREGSALSRHGARSPHELADALAGNGPFELGALSELWLDKTSRRSASSTDSRLLDRKTP